jgi:hypothetical protein
MIRLLLLSALLAGAPGAAPAQPLLAFVGEKVSVEEFDPARGPAATEPEATEPDMAFRAQYRVVDVVHGLAPGEVVEFEAYDPNGRPDFEPHRHVLLFLTKDGDRWVHLKHQFYPVFRTTSGAWAGCGSPYRYSGETRTVAPRPLDFGKDAHFDLAGLGREDIAALYPRPYFRTIGGKAYCRQGNTVEELFQVKQQGVLRARGLGQEPSPADL